MKIYTLSKDFPKEETYSLTDQIRRSSRSVCANLAFAVKCGYLPKEDGEDLYRTYDSIIRTVVGMINHPETWVIRRV
jgi:hypothetical protein